MLGPRGAGVRRCSEAGAEPSPEPRAGGLRGVLRAYGGEDALAAVADQEVGDLGPTEEVASLECCARGRGGGEQGGCSGWGWVRQAVVGDGCGRLGSGTGCGECEGAARLGSGREWAGMRHGVACGEGRWWVAGWCGPASRELCPCELVSVGSAEAASRARTASTAPILQAQSSAVSPLSSCSFTSAPYCRSRETNSCHPKSEVEARRAVFW